MLRFQCTFNYINSLCSILILRVNVSSYYMNLIISLRILRNLSFLEQGEIEQGRDPTCVWLPLQACVGCNPPQMPQILALLSVELYIYCFYPTFFTTFSIILASSNCLFDPSLTELLSKTEDLKSLLVGLVMPSNLSSKSIASKQHS